MTGDADPPVDPPASRDEGDRAPAPEDASGPDEGPGRDLVGEVVAGRYRVLSRLGQGAMGAVYLAEHLRMGRRDAIKVLSRSLADDDDARARFTREARNASFINHPNACTVYDFGEIADGLPFIAMEYVDGETLGEVLSREGRLPAGRAAELVAQVTRALEAAHARGIAHRDLKPDNIMITRAADGSVRAKVVDFGIAKAMEDEGGQNLTMPGWVVGTPEYVSPEQLAGQDLDGRSDLYSLGIVLFRMLTGGLPFEGDTWQEVMTNRLSQPPARLADVGGREFPPALEAMVRRALEREPEDRYPDAAAFRRALLEAVEASGPPSKQAPAAGSATAVVEGAASGGGDRPRPSRDAGGTADSGPAKSPGDRSVPRTSAMAEARDGSPERAAPPWSGLDRRQLAAGGGLLLALAAVAAWLLLGGGGGPSAGGAAEALERQLGRLEADPSQAAARAAGDTARSYWNLDGMEAADRALAAHVLGASLAALGDTGRAVDWLERATRLAPDETRYRRLLEAVGAGGEIRPDELAALLERQLGRLEDDPGSDAAAAVGDTGRLAWDLPEAAPADRALAAYVVGRARLARSDTAAAVRWLERGADLDPGSGRIAGLLARLTRRPEPEPGPSEDALAAGDAGPVLMRQFERLEDAPGPGALRAVRDTARVFVEMTGVADRDRAFAAHVLGVAWLGLRDTARAVPWLERAVELDPENAGYRTQLDVVTGGGP